MVAVVTPPRPVASIHRREVLIEDDEEKSADTSSTEQLPATPPADYIAINVLPVVEAGSLHHIRQERRLQRERRRLAAMQMAAGAATTMAALRYAAPNAAGLNPCTAAAVATGALASAFMTQEGRTAILEMFVALIARLKRQLDEMRQHNLHQKRTEHVPIRQRMFYAAKKLPGWLLPAGVFSGVTVEELWRHCEPDQLQAFIHRLEVIAESLVSNGAIVTLSTITALGAVVYAGSVWYSCSTDLKALKVDVRHVEDAHSEWLLACTALEKALALPDSTDNAAALQAAFYAFENQSDSFRQEVHTTMQRVSAKHNQKLFQRDICDTALKATAVLSIVATGGLAGVAASAGTRIVATPGQWTMGAAALCFAGGSGALWYGSSRCSALIQHCDELEVQLSGFLKQVHAKAQHHHVQVLKT